MSRYLLDTCFISELIRTRPNPGVTSWLANQAEETLLVSTIVVGELEKGIHKLTDETRRDAIRAWLNGPFKERFGNRIVSVDVPIAMRWGQILGENAKRGIVLPVIDAMLAATALEHGAIVVTRNIGDFERCGATVLNPWT